MLQTLCKSLRAAESQQAHDAAESWAWAPEESSTKLRQNQTPAPLIVIV